MTAEKEIMYDVGAYVPHGIQVLIIIVQAFNEELDGMFQDANLPQSEAWTAMTADLRHAKNQRNTLSKENS